jgi:predicted alpha/beta superfamily hydrolase
MNFVIERSKAVEVAVIGHSFGGIVIQKILEMSCKYDDQVKIQISIPTIF